MCGQYMCDYGNSKCNNKYKCDKKSTCVSVECAIKEYKEQMVFLNARIDELLAYMRTIDLDPNISTDTSTDTDINTKGKIIGAINLNVQNLSISLNNLVIMYNDFIKDNTCEKPNNC